MTTKDMLRKILTSLYYDTMRAYKFNLNHPESDFFDGMLQTAKDVFKVAPGIDLYEDYILWRYSPYEWGKYSEVLNCEQKD